MTHALNRIMEKEYNSNGLQDAGQLITAFQDQLFRFAFFRTGSPADAQDIVQDVFVKFFKNPQRPYINNIKHYLFKSIANACAGHQSKKKPLFESVDNISDSIFLQDKDASAPLLLAEAYQRTESILQKVPAEQAEVIRLRVLDNLDFTEIAELLQLPVTTVKSRFKYGIDKLKQLLHLKKALYEL
jgi:RNA polymerase sigma-70 factor, ECF subfamily